MSKYRQVQVSFWQDAFVLDLTPEEKYFYIYLMTNSKSSQIGIYELPKRIIETETGYNRETVDKLLQRFVEYGKIEYHEPTKEIYIKNWAKYNWNNSPKVVARVQVELKDVKYEPFVEKYLNVANNIKSDTVSILYARAIDSPEILVRKDKEKDKDKENDKEQQQTEKETKKVVDADAPGKAFRFYEQNISYLVPHIAERISIMIDESSEELVHEALKRSVEANARNKMNFADSILSSWKRQKIVKLADVVAADKEFERRKRGSLNGTTSKHHAESSDEEWDGLSL
ncbi:Phage replication protein [Planococcus halocryophilus Or1]|uniref:DNA replication protein DnaD n=1 Tax=Planococcus halocryophilus TaxID=1215089 RepID=A0A1C7DPZ3_9BACL|nr:DnaD domain protein [Planococcus halocryophilus]ANU13487.1 DNA replication protein DnaD [Planococcus halocryophilus]EMF46296.1 Phage replication protein [Planococcus halocryophilus Or1]